MYGPIDGPRLFSDLIEAYRQLDLHPLGTLTWGVVLYRSTLESIIDLTTTDASPDDYWITVHVERPVDSMIGHSNETKGTPKLLAIESAKPFDPRRVGLSPRRYWRIKHFSDTNELENLLSKCYEDENFSFDLRVLLEKHEEQGNLEKMSLEEWIELLIERGHAFRITPENPWSPPMSEDDDEDGDEHNVMA
ncbi:hypothetical protein CTRI78_v008009 [Colletotrichum trifolii]|uniref:Uncharacterized protein n=1 Tax=Colletotrichum trifolii TaxID=5466 RepID=A0A4V3HUZ3_COLTR|nr:hypothetical protein CTRI78_v008009 [Colletotrichum trifolii]